MDIKEKIMQISSKEEVKVETKEEVKQEKNKSKLFVRDTYGQV